MAANVVLKALVQDQSPNPPERVVVSHGHANVKPPTVANPRKGFHSGPNRRRPFSGVRCPARARPLPAWLSQRAGYRRPVAATTGLRFAAASRGSRIRWGALRVHVGGAGRSTPPLWRLTGSRRRTRAPLSSWRRTGRSRTIHGLADAGGWDGNKAREGCVAHTGQMVGCVRVRLVEPVSLVKESRANDQRQPPGDDPSPLGDSG